jgi:FlgO protein
MRISGLASLTALALLAGCGGQIVDTPPQLVQGRVCPAYQPPTRLYASEPEALPELTYAAIDKITFCARDVVSERVPITVSSITDSQHLDQSSAFGNMVADFARARLAENHMTVSEPRLRSGLWMRVDQGEMFLSRDKDTLTQPHPLYAAVLTGTYGVGANHVFVSLKLIRADNTQLLSAADFVLTRYGDVEALLSRP